MTTCKHCDTTENIVYSATDALLLGHLDAVERICYNCAQPKQDKQSFEARIQRHALGQFLSSWDNGLSYEQVLDILDGSDGDVTDDRILVWHSFAYDTGSNIAINIRDLHEVMGNLVSDVWDAGARYVRPSN